MNGSGWVITIGNNKGLSFNLSRYTLTRLRITTRMDIHYLHTNPKLHARWKITNTNHIISLSLCMSGCSVLNGDEDRRIAK